LQKIAKRYPGNVYKKLQTLSGTIAQKYFPCFKISQDFICTLAT